MKNKIFALPYAFGASYIYNDLKSNLKSDYEIIPLEYPGHGTRLMEDMSDNIQDLAEDIFKQMQKHILDKDQEYAVLGYSMGSIVGFELLKILQEKNMKNPKVFFAFASPAPNREEENEDYENYSIEDVKSTLDKKNGTPKDVLENEEILDLIAPIVVNDLIALRDYNNHFSKIKVECPLVVVRGKGEDGRNEENIKDSYKEWKKFSNGDSSYYEIEGEHFFMFENEKNLKRCCDIIKNNL